MAVASLKLVTDREPDTLPFNRRRCARHGLSGHVTALRTLATPAGLNKKICSLMLLNISDSGLGVLTQESLEIGSTVTVLFPPHGPERGFDAVGRVVRCVRRDGGHEVGIRFDERAAA